MLSLVSALYVGSKVSVQYEADASLLVLSPAVAEDAEGVNVPTNPFALTGEAERVVASAMLATAASEQWAAAMEANGAEGDSEYELWETAPIIDVRSTAETPEEALNTLDVTLGLFRERLAENQSVAGAPEDRLFASELLGSTVEPTALTGSRVRTMAAVFVLGLLVTATVLFLVDSLVPGPTSSPPAANRRTARKDKPTRPRRHEGPHAEDDPDAMRLPRRPVPR